MMETPGIVDLRSDTVTRPSDEMRNVMATAPVGDDVMQEDPTVNELEKYTAKLFGMEAGLFVASGTMANQVAVRAYCGHGDEILTVGDCHLFFYEAGSAAGLSGVQLFPVPTNNGLFDVADFARRIRSDDPHFPRTRLFWVENTHNRGGGRIVPFELMKALRTLALESGIPVHVDGARICNAAVATGIAPDVWAGQCNSISICLSKGLGAPVGSVICGSEKFIYRCRRARKALGGGMRQAGIIAAGGLFALKNNFQRLADDHRLAKLLAENLDKLDGISAQPPDTNIVMIDLEPDSGLDAAQCVELLKSESVLMFDVGPMRLRAVTHLDVDESGIHKTIAAFQKFIAQS